MPRPRSLTPDQLAGAALDVIDRDGLAALTMRAVAKALGVSTMGLYRYVADRAELECLVVEHVLRDVDTARPSGRSWRSQIERLVLRLHEAVDSHPGVVPLAVAHRQSSPSILRWSETVLAVLTDAGLAGRRRVVALRALLSYTLGAIQLQHDAALAGAGTEALAFLPPGQFPLLPATAGEARGLSPAEELRGGLRLLLAGIDASLAG